MTRLIGGLGVTLPADPNPPAPDNVEGYWEPSGVVYLNDRLLTAADSAWLDTRDLDLSRVPHDVLLEFRERIAAALEKSFGASRLFVLKDPRISRMVSFYRDILASQEISAKAVIVLRHPGAVAASLHTRNQISPLYSGLLWAIHLLDAERSTRGTPRIIVDYDATVSDWRPSARRIGQLLGVDGEAVDPEALPRPHLRHHVDSFGEMFDTPARTFLTELYDALMALREQDTAAAHAVLDRLRAGFVELSQRLDDVITAERCYQRLTSPYDAVAPLDPARERLDLAAAFGRLQQSAVRGVSAPNVGSGRAESR